MVSLVGLAVVEYVRVNVAFVSEFNSHELKQYCEAERL